MVKKNKARNPYYFQYKIPTISENMNAYKYLEFRIHHFSFYFFLVRPVYFLLSFLERTV